MTTKISTSPNDVQSSITLQQHPASLYLSKVVCIRLQAGYLKLYNTPTTVTLLYNHNKTHLLCYLERLLCSLKIDNPQQHEVVTSCKILTRETIM